MIHLFSSVEDRKAVQQALQLEDDKLWCLQDNLCDGPLSSEESDDTFDTIRTKYAIAIKHLNPEAEGHNDVASIMKLSSFLSNDDTEELTLWLAPNTLNVITYYFVIHHLSKHLNRLNIINIGGLPFIDENGKLYFPKYIKELNEKEVEKCGKLSRKLSPVECEIDGEEWKKLRKENAAIRILDGTKNIKSLQEDYYDGLLKSHHKDGQKPQRTAQLLINKNGVEVSIEFLISRVAQMNIPSVTNTVNVASSEE